MEQIVFWVLALGALLSGAAVVLPPFGRNPLHAALSLVVCLFFLAGLFLTLSASFLAAMQVLVYAGAIMVLFVFVVMMLNLSSSERSPFQVSLIKIGAGLSTLFIVGKLAKTFWLSAGSAAPASLEGHQGFGSIGNVAEILFRQFLLPFELTSLLLLVAVVAAVIVARNKIGRGID